MDQPLQLLDLVRLGGVIVRIERAAHDEQAEIVPQLRVAKEQQPERAKEDIDALDLLDASDEEDDALALIASEHLACVHLPHRTEHVQIDAARDDVQRRGICAVQIDELTDLDLTRSGHGGGLAHGTFLDRDAHVALAIDVLVHDLALDQAERVEHLDARHAPARRQRSRDLGREPVVRVDQVVTQALVAHILLDLGGELVEMLVDVHLRPVPHRTRGDVDHARVVAERLNAWVVLLAPAGEDVHGDAATPQLARQLANVHVHAA